MQMLQAGRFCGGKLSEFIANDVCFLGEGQAWVISRRRACGRFEGKGDDTVQSLCRDEDH